MDKPLAGAEILNDRVRRIISTGKCWVKFGWTLREKASQVKYHYIPTMMFGHVETIEERFEHLVLIREVQSEKPADFKRFQFFHPVNAPIWMTELYFKELRELIILFLMMST